MMLSGAHTHSVSSLIAQTSGNVLAIWAAQTGIAVTMLILFILVIRRPFARAFGARAAYALWLLPIIRFVMPGVTRPSWMPDWLSPPISQSLLQANSGLPVSDSLAGPFIDAGAAPVIFATDIPAVPMAEIQSGLTHDHIIAVVLTAWLTIAALWLGLQLWRHARASKALVQNSHPANYVLKNKARRAARNIGLTSVSYRLRVANGQTGPLVTGLWRPLIVLPQCFTDDLNERQQYYALMHELSHIKRADLWVAMGALIFRALNWPNPLVHYAARKFRHDQEAACDAFVLRNVQGDKAATHEYAQTLLMAAKSTLANAGPTIPNMPPIPSMKRAQVYPLGLTLTHPLKDRLMFLNSAPSRLRKIGMLTSSVLIAGGVAFTIPVSYAEVHPDTLAGAAPEIKKRNTSKNVMSFVTEIDGKTVKKKFTVTVDGDDVDAFEVHPITGRKTRINPRDIDGFELNELAKGGAFSLSKNGKLVFLDADQVKDHANRHLPRAPHAPVRPVPPVPPVIGDVDSQSFVFSFDMDEMKPMSKLEALQGLQGLQGLEGLKALEKLEGLKALEKLKSLERLSALTELADLSELSALTDMDMFHEGQVFISKEGIESDGNVSVYMNKDGKFIASDIQQSTAMLDAAANLLDSVKAKTEFSNMSYDAQQKLEAARRALKEAEAALEASE